MKNLLLFNYNIDIDDIIKISDKLYSFYIDYAKFYIVKINRIKPDIIAIYKIISQTINPYHLIVKNRFNNIFTEQQGETYILLKIKTPENIELDLNDIITNQILVKDGEADELKRTDWGNLWSSKIDYLEYQVSELGTNHNIVRKSFSYYVGLAENAIEYFNMLKIENIDLVLSHKRINFPNINLNYYNPLNIVIDYKVRDLSGYIKSAFFEGHDVTKEMTALINKNVLTPLEYNLLFVRLLYPSYYFDDLNKVIEQNADDEILLKYIEKVDSYEKFLKDTYNLLSKKCQLIKIDWLIK